MNTIGCIGICLHGPYISADQNELGEVTSYER